MGLKSVTVQLSEDVYSAVQEAAQASHRSVEDVLRDSLDIFFSDLATADIDTLLNQMSSYTNEQLWAVAYRKLTSAQSLRLDELTAKNKQGNLLEAEQAELDQLLNLIDRHMLLRSEAILLLKRRGQDIESFSKMSLHV